MQFENFPNAKALTWHHSQYQDNSTVSVLISIHSQRRHSLRQGQSLQQKFLNPMVTIFMPLPKLPRAYIPDTALPTGNHPPHPVHWSSDRMRPLL